MPSSAVQFFSRRGFTEDLAHRRGWERFGEDSFLPQTCAGRYGDGSSGIEPPAPHRWLKA